jgi:transposase/transcriptional regulator with XRE-family HTH domain
MRVAPAIKLTEAERKKLKSIAGSPRQPLRLIQRANIVLMAEKGLENVEIAQRLNVSVPLVGRWRRRYAASNFAGIEKDKTRPPGKPKTEPALVQTILDKTMQETPIAQTHWSQHSMAKAAGVSPSTVGRIWRAHGLKPHLVKTFKLSNDRLFAEKLEDVVGLYINPPEHAVVLCADEKSQIQALDRTQPGLPIKPGRAGTMTHDYKRYGVTTLFAALNTLDGSVISTCMDRHRHTEWLKFLRLIDESIDEQLDVHLIADNYATHKHAKVQRWLKRHPRFHMHFTPTSSSWLNMVERFFRDITTQAIRRGVFRSVDALIAAIQAYIVEHNREPKPFIWTATASDILEKVKRGRQALYKVQSE